MSLVRAILIIDFISNLGIEATGTPGNNNFRFVDETVEGLDFVDVPRGQFPWEGGEPRAGIGLGPVRCVL